MIRESQTITTFWCCRLAVVRICAQNAWYRRVSNSKQFFLISGQAITLPQSKLWSGVWQRRRVSEGGFQAPP